ncbi:MAG TPA: GNAT family N-acetyltransferase [Solirubrobacteraceae bacterium]
MGGAAELIDVRPLDAAGGALVVEHWSDVVVRRGESIPVAGLPGFVAWLGDQRASLLTYAVRGSECEVVTLHSPLPGHGAGRAVMDAARGAAEAAGCRRLWLVTTNDNVRALAFYQRWGLDLCSFRRGAVNESHRTLKPTIPLRDAAGIPIAHELELELLLAADV